MWTPQGIVVEIVPELGFFLDDGTGSLVVQEQKMSQGVADNLKLGDYVQSIGFLGHLQAEDPFADPLLCIGKAIVVPLNADVDQDTLWWLEVIDAQSAVAAGVATRIDL